MYQASLSQGLGKQLKKVKVYTYMQGTVFLLINAPKYNCRVVLYLEQRNFCKSNWHNFIALRNWNTNCTALMVPITKHQNKN